LTQTEPYNLSIGAEFPKKVRESKTFSFRYRIKNLSDEVFPGSYITVEAFWPTLGKEQLIVTRTFEVKKLEPKEVTYINQEETPATSGLMVFYSPEMGYGANDGRPCFLRKENGDTLKKGELFAVVRAKSDEEVSGSRNLAIAATSLIILIVIQIVDWLVRYYYRW
jgi:hypothetical protein